MKVEDYYRNVLVPANGAVSAIRRAGMPVDIWKVRKLRSAWFKELAELEAFVEGEAAKVGHVLKYSDKHSVNTEKLAEFLYGTPGLGLEYYGQGSKRKTDDEALSVYASLKVPRDDDHPVVKAIIQIRSLQKATATYFGGFERAYRADGAIHPKYNWALRTARISATDPPVHGIPERSDKRIADGIKSTFVPRRSPAPSAEEWDPRIHGSVWRWDISGAEACWRAACLTYRAGVTDPIAYDYLRAGKDIHSKTASMVYDVPEGTYKKGDYERDATAKQTFFSKQYGAKWRTVQKTVWKAARIWIDDDTCIKVCDNFDKGYVGLTKLYQIDQDLLGTQGWCQDAYGRRRMVGLPDGVSYLGDLYWDLDGLRWTVGQKIDWKDDNRKELAYRLENHMHIMANTPTQSANAIDNHFMLALAYFGEYVPLQVPPMWERDGIPYPEAKEWRLHEGPGPGGKPMLSWHINTVHDSGWGDCAPGYLEPTAKLIWRRCRAIPMDWRIEADVPYRVDFSVGPDMATLFSYNKIAKKFDLEPLVER